MPAVLITGGSVCAGGEHRLVETDRGTYQITTGDITAMIPETAEEFKNAFIIVVRHLYWTRRAAGRTHNQALGDLV